MNETMAISNVKHVGEATAKRMLEDGISSVAEVSHLSLEQWLKYPAATEEEYLPMIASARQLAAGSPAVASGEWTGEFIDAEGHRAALVMDLDSNGSTISGTFCLTRQDHHGSHAHHGTVSGTFDGCRVTLACEIGGAPHLWLNGELNSTIHHASQSMHGISAPHHREHHAGGVWIAWRSAATVEPEHHRHPHADADFSF